MIHNHHCNISLEKYTFKKFLQAWEGKASFQLWGNKQFTDRRQKVGKTVIIAIGGTVIGIVLPSWRFIDASKPSTTTPGRKESAGLVWFVCAELKMIHRLGLSASLIAARAAIFIDFTFWWKELYYGTNLRLFSAIMSTADEMIFIVSYKGGISQWEVEWSVDND